jgi:hypothetical protein
MNLKNKLLIALNVVYGFIVLLFLGDYFSLLEISSQLVKSMVYLWCMAGTLLMLMINLILIQNKIFGRIGFVIPALVAFGIIYLNPVDLFYKMATWKTQTILFESTQSPNITIDFQMQDAGPSGYNMRTVEVYKFGIIFRKVREVNLGNLNSVEWIEVNKIVNELGLKGM